MRPLGPSISAGLSCKRAACRRTYSVTVTSGIVTAGLALLMIIALPRVETWSRHRTAGRRRCQMSDVPAGTSAGVPTGRLPPDRPPHIDGARGEPCAERCEHDAVAVGQAPRVVPLGEPQGNRSGHRV